ncbi:hypothetical protein FKO01_41260 [Mesorhizobium sp. B2-3-3]|nr:hypothetical protein FKO01_41260 [Mesorhizobium sp. B2-3-3]
MKDKNLLLLTIWRLRCNRASKGHFFATTLFHSFDYLFTFVNVAASIAVLGLSSATWISKGTEFTVWLNIAAIVTVITSILQYILDFRITWKEHERASRSYGTVNRAIEHAIASGQVEEKEIAGFRGRLDELGARSPTIPRIIWNRPKALSRTIMELEAQLTDDTSN